MHCENLVRGRSSDRPSWRQRPSIDLLCPRPHTPLLLLRCTGCSHTDQTRRSSSLNDLSSPPVRSRSLSRCPPPLPRPGRRSRPTSRPRPQDAQNQSTSSSSELVAYPLNFLVTFPRRRPDGILLVVVDQSAESLAAVAVRHLGSTLPADAPPRSPAHAHFQLGHGKVGPGHHLAAEQVDAGLLHRPEPGRAAPVEGRLPSCLDLEGQGQGDGEERRFARW